MQTKHFTTGINPQTGGQSYRSMVYEAMIALPNTIITPNEMISLFPNHKAQAIKDALSDIILYPEQYPGMHRVALGKYKYDPTTPAIICQFPNMGRKKQGRKGQGRRTVIATTPPTPPAQEAPKSDIAPKSDTPTFSTVLPIFDRTSGTMLATDTEVMLVDAEGRYWHAKRV